MSPDLPEDLLDSIYQVAIDDGAWSASLQAISAQFGGAPAQVGVWDLNTGSVPFGLGFGFLPNMWEIASEYYATTATNPTLAIAMRSPLHHAVDQSAEIGEAAFQRLALYADIYAPNDIMPLLGTVLSKSAGEFSGFAVMRATSQPPATAEQFSLAEGISRHLARALRLSMTSGNRGSLEAAFDCACDGIVLIKPDASIVRINAAAQVLLADGGALLPNDRVLTLAEPAGRVRLQLAIAKAVAGDDAVFSVRGADSALVVRVQPLARAMRRGGAQLLVTLSPLRARTAFDPIEAAALFGLTAAEARAACEICVSGSLAGVAASLGVTRNTLKTLLQRVFEKTEVRSQKELALLFAACVRSGGVAPARKGP